LRLKLFYFQIVWGEPLTWNAENGRVIKKVGELLAVHGGAGDQELELGPKPGDVLDKSEEHVGVQGALVRLVYDEHTVRVEVGLAKELAQQHAVGHVLDERPLRGAVLEADGVAHLLAQLHAHLLGDARRHAHRGHAPRLRAADLLLGAVD